MHIETKRPLPAIFLHTLSLKYIQDARRYTTPVELPLKGQIQRLKTVSTVAIVTTGYNSFNPYLDSLYLTSSWFLAGKFLPFRDERFSGESTPEPLDLCKPGRGPLLLEDLYPKESATTKRVPLIKIRNEQ